MAEETYDTSKLPPMFCAIAAMSENRVIGANGKIPWHIPDDFRWFKHKTMGGTLIMGRKTFESIGKPLPGRKTIVVTRSNLQISGVEVVADIAALLKKEIANAWICGGAQIYEEALASCAYLYLTRVKKESKGDAYFPEFEDTFRLVGEVHETAEYRIECWRNLKSGWQLYGPLASPFPFDS
jgi:dihydrofolate reductase